MGRQLRADARRNREALLRAARVALMDAESDLRVGEVARTAGVAVGTLYRHFETREALVEQVFRQELDDLCDFAEDGDLHAFLVRLVGYSTTSKVLAKALEAVMVTASPMFDEARRRMEETLDTLLARGAETGSLRTDLTGQTVLRALGGICSPLTSEAESLRIVELLFDGLRYGAATPGGSPQATATVQAVARRL